MEDTSWFNAGKSNKERKQDSIKRKALFITAYEEWGTIKKSCEIASITRKTFKNWSYSDTEFSNDMAEAKKTFGETLEAIALDRVKNPDKGKGSDILLLGMLNANMSEKYRPNMAMNEDSAREVISELRKISREKKGDGPVEEGDRGLSDPYKKQLVELLDKKSDPSKTTEEPAE